MSYSFELFRIPEGIEPDSAWNKHIEEQETRMLERIRGVYNYGETDPDKQRSKHQLAASLIAHIPSLKMFMPDYTKIAKAKSISEPEARRRFRDVELNEHQLRIQITLFDDSVGLSIAAAGREHLRHALQTAWSCLRILSSDGGFAIHDSQIGAVLNLNTDFNTVFECYRKCHGEID